MNERMAKSARLGSGAGHQLAATGTQPYFSGKPRSGRVRTERRASLLIWRFLSPQEQIQVPLPVISWHPWLSGLKDNTHTHPQALVEMCVFSWDKQAVPQREHNFCVLEGMVGRLGEQLLRIQQAKTFPQLP